MHDAWPVHSNVMSKPMSSSSSWEEPEPWGGHVARISHARDLAVSSWNWIDCSIMIDAGVVAPEGRGVAEPLVKIEDDDEDV